MPHAAHVLVVDDHVEMARLLADQLGDLGYEVAVARDGRHALERVAEAMPDVLLTDVRMPRVDGMELLDAVHALDPALPVIVMTAFGSNELAVEAMARGAFHYLTKPFRLDEVRVLVEKALADRRLRRENASLRVLAADRVGRDALIGSSPALQGVLERLDRAARVDVPVLVRGESGTGKELVARALHLGSRRSGGPFVSVNCSALPATLLESELFGHGRGAFTGATGVRRGLFVEADGGTLFLDEIGEMAVELQSRLLRVLEDGEIRPVGADKPRRVDVRVVCATHQPLEQRVAEGRFREDLLFRINVVELRLPPLRERLDDLPQLVEHFLAEAHRAWPDMAVQRLSPAAMAALARRPWPGNVRELRNVVHRLAVLIDRPVVGLEDLALLGAVAAGGPPAAGAAVGPDLPAADPPATDPPATDPPAAAPPGDVWARALAEGWSLEQVRDAYIGAVMERCGHNKTRASRVLGVDPSTLYRWERSGR